MNPTHVQRVLEIEAETGLDLLTDLFQSSVSVPGPGSESGMTHLQKHGSGIGIDQIDSILLRYGGLKPGDLIDFLGGPCSGKTTALYAITIASILPKSWKHTRGLPPLVLNGRSKHVIFVDMDLGFSGDRLKSLISLHIHTQLKVQQQELVLQQQSQGYQSKVDQLVASCLQKVHVFRPPSASSTILMLRSMDHYLTRVASQNPFANSPFALLILDSISSFYWQEKLHNNHTRAMSQIIDALDRLVKRWKLVFVTTSWSLPSPNVSILDRTTTEALRARIKFRFLIQPSSIQRYPSEREVVQEWMTRRGPSAPDQDADLFTLFQAQMIAPNVEHKEELFRMSISGKDGILLYCPPFS
ncbi:hypothetical protein BGZ94_006480 [Podila epigama]|nr:hypothetical protein BGZ94_006480 [Podila epigama]